MMLSAILVRSNMASGQRVLCISRWRWGFIEQGIQRIAGEAVPEMARRKSARNAIIQK